jgi:phosphotransferase system IIB component
MDLRLIIADQSPVDDRDQIRNDGVMYGFQKDPRGTRSVHDPAAPG